MGRSMDWDRVHRQDRLYRSFRAEGGGAGGGRLSPGGSRRSAAAGRGQGGSRRSTAATSLARRERVPVQTAASETNETVIQWRSDSGWVRRGPGGTWVAARPSARIAGMPPGRGKRAKRRSPKQHATAAAAVPAPPKSTKPPKAKQRVQTPRRGSSIDKFFHQAREAQRAGSRAYTDGIDPPMRSGRPK
jgi:hypothetical protein